MEPTQQLNWIKGLRNAFKTIGARQIDQYSWVAKTDDAYAFTAEIDHIDQANNQYDHKGGVFKKWVKPLSTVQGVARQTIRHSQELLDAIKNAHEEGKRCRLLLVKGTKNGKTAGGVRAAVDADSWIVTEFSGSVSDGFGFTLERTK
jgi:hypothetical protein